MSFNYIAVDQDKFVKYDLVSKISKVLSISDLQTELANVLNEIENLPPPPTDEDLLAWAREHFPGIDYEPRRAFLEQKKIEIETDLGAVQ